MQTKKNSKKFVSFTIFFASSDIGLTIWKPFGAHHRIEEVNILMLLGTRTLSTLRIKKHNYVMKGRKEEPCGLELELEISI